MAHRASRWVLEGLRRDRTLPALAITEDGRRLMACGDGSGDTFGEVPWAELRERRAIDGWELLKKSRRRTVVRRGTGTDAVVIKRRQVAWPSALAESWLRPPKEVREFAAAARWRRAGLPTCLPLTVVLDWEEGVGAVRLLVTRAMPAHLRSLKSIWRETGLDDVRWDRLARHVSALNEGGALHRDLQAAHLFVDPTDTSGSGEVWSVDLDGSFVGRQPTRFERGESLVRLFASVVTSGFDERWAERFLRAYDPEQRWSFSPARLARAARWRHH